MKVTILYDPRSEHARKVEDFVREMSRMYDRPVTVLDMNSREGNDKAMLYDIMQFPAILATSQDGSLLKSWLGPILPLMDEVVYYADDRLQNTSM